MHIIFGEMNMFIWTGIATMTGMKAILNILKEVFYYQEKK
jgi:hypothetical protein